MLAKAESTCSRTHLGKSALVRQWSDCVITYLVLQRVQFDRGNEGVESDEVNERVWMLVSTCC